MSTLDVTKADKNMTVAKKISTDGFTFYDIDSEPFRIYGVRRSGDKYIRIPKDVAATVNEGVEMMHATGAGGRIRFVTDSRRFAFIVKCDGGMSTENGAYMNRTSLDLYADGEFVTVTRAGNDFPITYYEYIGSPIEGEKKDRVITVYMPNYGEIHHVLIGLEEGSSLKAAPDYKYEKPVVFYGSSITQGGCCSRPALSYQSVLERDLDMDYINLGFSGRAHGEPTMANYIAGLDMSAFVLDYDHNAKDLEELQTTHEPFYKTIRAAHPDIPILILTRPKYISDADDAARRDIIRCTYDNAIAAGDKNVYYFYGKEFFTEIGSEGLCDGCHPNDLGFRYMAKGIYPVLKNALESKG